MRRGQVQVIEEAAEEAAQPGKRHLGHGGRSAVTGHVPGDAPVPPAELAKLQIESMPVAADAVQKDDGFAGARLLEQGNHQASSPCSTPSTTTASPSRNKEQLRSGRSKWPRV